MFRKVIGIVAAITILLIVGSYIYEFANQVSDWVFFIPVGLALLIYGFGKLAAWLLEKPIPSKLRKIEETIPPPTPKPQQIEEQ